MSALTTDENLNVLARFIGRAVGVSGDLFALEALSAVKAELADAERRRRSVPSEEGGPGHEEIYWFRAKLDAAILSLRDIEDYYRTKGGLRESFNMVRADRARDIYEQISEDFFNGRVGVPTIRERLGILLGAAERLLDRYILLVASGDCGHWDPEKEKEVIDLRAAIASVKG